MSSFVHNPKTWGITLAEYEKLGWGSAVSKFKVPNSVIKRFRKTVWVKSDGTVVETVPSDPSNYKEETRFDVDSAFYELGFTYISAITASYEILRITPFSALEGGITIGKNGDILIGPYEGSTQDWLRKAVFNAIEYAVLNKQIWEKINSSSITTPNFTISQDQTAWLITSDMTGMKAQNCLTNSELEDYEWIDSDVFLQNTPKGNVRVLGKVSLNDLPDLAIE